MATLSFEKIETNENGVNWYQIEGTDYGTGVCFETEVFGVTNEGRILDCDGAPLTEGDTIEIAVRNALSI